MKLDISGIKLYSSKEIKKDILGRELKAGDVVAAYKKGGIVLGVFNGKSVIASTYTVRTSQYLKIEHPDEAMIQVLNNLNAEIINKEAKTKAQTIKMNKPLTFYSYPQTSAGLVLYLGLCELKTNLVWDTEIYKSPDGGHFDYREAPQKKDLITSNTDVKSEVIMRGHMYLSFTSSRYRKLYEHLKSENITYDEVIKIITEVNTTYGSYQSLGKSKKILIDKIGDGSMIYPSGIEIRPVPMDTSYLVELATVDNIDEAKERFMQGISIDITRGDKYISKCWSNGILEAKKFVSSSYELKLIK